MTIELGEPCPSSRSHSVANVNFILAFYSYYLRRSKDGFWKEVPSMWLFNQLIFIGSFPYEVE